VQTRRSKDHLSLVMMINVSV